MEALVTQIDEQALIDYARQTDGGGDEDTQEILSAGSFYPDLNLGGLFEIGPDDLEEA